MENQNEANVAQCDSELSIESCSAPEIPNGSRVGWVPMAQLPTGESVDAYGRLYTRVNGGLRKLVAVA